MKKEFLEKMEEIKEMVEDWMNEDYDVLSSADWLDWCNIRNQLLEIEEAVKNIYE